MIFERDTGKILTTGTAHEISEYLRNYRATGDPNRPLGNCVEITGWHDGAKKVAASKAIRAATTDGLAAAKSHVDSALEGQEVTINCQSVESAKALASALCELGWISRQIPE